MEFDTKRMLKLAGVSDGESTASKKVANRPLVESTRHVNGTSADEQKLRSLIRREAQKMLGERALRVANPDVSNIQQKKSLTEAITMGFAGFGFGGKSPVLGGPMTSASRIFGLQESELQESPVDECDEDAEPAGDRLGETDEDY